MAIMVVLSVNNSRMITLPWQGFTLAWYGKVFRDPALLAAFRNSVLLGAATAGIAAGLALLLALGFRRPFPGKNVVFNLLLLPILIPGIVLGVGLLSVMGLLGLSLSLWTSVLAVHVIYTLPYAFLALYTRLHKFDRSLEEASMDLGATGWQTFWRVVFPLVRPGILGAMLFAFTLSFDEFVRTFFLIGNEATLPVQIFSMLFHYLSPEVNALAVMILAISTAGSLLGQWCVNRSRT
jgi:ABC-type spermidine/putrescine transport system permease subunit II